MPYYGVYVPVKGGAGVATVQSHISTACNNPLSSAALDRDTAKSSYVFREKTDALQILKQHKDSRLKEFHNEDDAVKYAQTGYEVVQTKYKDSKAPNTSLEKAAFRAPTKKERIDFRNAIESGNYERVKTMIWDNPRYLVSSGDTPTTLKEGCRYNAMHLCAVHRRPNVAELILKTVSDTKFADLLTGKKNDQKMCQELCANLLDYYLNMPEKVLNETPLHLAAKWGCVPMVEVLISYAECKMTRNNMNLLPEQIICSRDVGSEPFAHRTIKMLLKERFYVPVLRCNDDSVPAQIGQPFSSNSSPSLTCDHLSPEVEIKALAGPMSKTEAEQFFRRWKTPPRLRSNLSSPVVNKLFLSPMKHLPPASSTPHKTPIFNKLNFSTPTATLQRRALFKSTEVETLNEFATSIDKAFNVEPHGNSKRIGISLLSNDQLKSESNNNNEATTAIETVGVLKPSLCPGTPLYKIRKDAFFTYRDTNVASPLINRFGVNIDNEFGLMNTSGIYDTPSFIERHIKNSDPEKGLECIGRELAREQSVEWREYWDFLEEFVDIAAPKGLEKLENYLAQHHREIYNQNQKTANTSVIFHNVCSALEKFGFSPALQKTGHNGEIVQDENGLRRDLSHSGINASLVHQLSTPYTYVEKSLQVHAKRMTKTIIHNIDNLTSISDSLVLELRRVKSLIYSFKEDVSFFNVSFEKVHSRIGNLVSIFLNNSQEITFVIKLKILNIIQNLILARGERREHMECVLNRIRDTLEHSVEQILPENLKTEEMCSKIWLEERNCNCGWESNLNRKTSRRNRMEARFKNHQRFKQHENSFKQQSHLVKLNATSNNSNGVCRTPCSSNDSSEDEEVHWTDAYSEVESTDSDGNEVWLTPPDSPSRISLRDDNSHFEQQVYICGNEPTKRDLDVLNAIFHIEIDNVKYPNIHSWKSALMHYPNEELDYFPSPRVNKKSYSFMLNKSDSTLQIPLNQQGHSQSLRDSLNSSCNLFKTCNEMVKDQMKKQPNITEPASKDLPVVGVPSLSKTVNDSKSENTTSTLLNFDEFKKQHQRPLTPINKLHGLFSSYREPLNVSSTSFNSPSNLSNASNNFNQNI